MRLEIHARNYELSDGLKDLIERRVRTALGRFARRIDRVTVSLSDVNGPRGGADKLCRLSVALLPRGSRHAA